MSQEKSSVMTKPVWENECEELGHSTLGSTAELRADSDEYQVAAESSRSSDHAPAGKPFGAHAMEDSMGDSIMTMFLHWMTKQEERREAEEKRRREEESKRWEVMMKTVKENRRADRESRVGASGVLDYKMIQRTVDRWDKEVYGLVQQMQGDIEKSAVREVIENYVTRLEKYDMKLSKILDENVDLLDGDKNKDDLVRRIYTMITDVNTAKTDGMKYVNKQIELQRDRAKAGPLPAGIEPPKFDGNVLHYQQWWDHFRSLVHDNRSVGKFWKMRYLMKAVEGSAASVLAGKKGLEEEYEEAVDMIQKRYGKQHTVVRFLVNEIASGNVPANDSTSFGTFVGEVKSHLSSLDAYNASRDMVVVSLLETRLPSSIRMDWEREVCSLVDAGKTPTTKDLVKFLDVEYEAICAKALLRRDSKVEKQKRSEPSTSSPARVTSVQSLVVHSSEKSDETKTRKCVDCKGRHMLLDCTSFKNKKKGERRKLASENKVCFKCLKGFYSPYHRCRIRRCKECGYLHHEMISCPPNRGQEEPEDTYSCSAISVEGNEVLPTVLAKARCGDRELVVRLGLDSMSQKTFITSAAARRLGLPSIGKKTISVQGFGGTTTVEQVDKVQFDITSVNGGPTLTIGAYVKEGSVCAPLKAVKIQVKDYPHLAGLPLSDPDIPEGSHIDILIGQAPLQEIVLDEIVRPQGGRQPTAWKTVFGYALMGPLPGNQDSTTACLFTTVNELDETLDAKVERFWSRESWDIDEMNNTLAKMKKGTIERPVHRLHFLERSDLDTEPTKDNQRQSKMH
jgi:hypothetical protein